MLLIVGLGNPGAEYTRTRHNIGFACVDTLAERHGLHFSDKRAKARLAAGTILGQRVALAKPQTFMNLSGQSVVGLCQWYKLSPAEDLLVVYDDLDLPFGVLRLRMRGSAGTHNGMRSIVGLLGTQGFPRLRVGINGVPPGWNAARYVLSRFAPEEESRLPEIVTAAAQAIETVLRSGFTTAMNQINAPEGGRRTSMPPTSDEPPASTEA